jgi:hypothetical protein
VVIVKVGQGAARFFFAMAPELSAEGNPTVLAAAWKAFKAWERGEYEQLAASTSL